MYDEEKFRKLELSDKEAAWALAEWGLEPVGWVLDSCGSLGLVLAVMLLLVAVLVRLGRYLFQDVLG